MRVLFAGVAALLLLAAPMDAAQAQAGEGSDITTTPPRLGTLRGGAKWDQDSRARSVPSPAYTVGEKIRFVLTVTPAVTVTGTPRVRLLFGEGIQYDYGYHGWGRDGFPDGHPRQVTRYADYDAAESSPTELIFSYTVQASDFDPDGFIVPDPPIDANGGAIVTRGGMLAADLDERFVGAMQAGCGTRGTTANCRVNGGGTRVAFTGTPASGTTYRLGEQIRAAVTFSEAVTVTGTPQIGLTVGSQTRQAIYDASRSSQTELVFAYTVRAADYDRDGISIAFNALDLNGGTITLTRDATKAAVLQHMAIAQDGSRKVSGGGKISGDFLRVSSVEFTGLPLRLGDTYRLEDQIRVEVTFSKGVGVTGTPQIGLTIGSLTQQAIYRGYGSDYDAAHGHYVYNERKLLFSYEVQASDLDTDGISIAANALNLNGGTIRLRIDPTTASSLGHAAVATDTTRKVDGRPSHTRPELGTLRGGAKWDQDSRARSVPSPAYTVGEKIRFVLTVTPAVTVTGTPRVRLLFGEGIQYDYGYHGWGRDGFPDGHPRQVTRYADYDAAESSPTELIFSYTVQASDFDPDGFIVPDPPIDANGGAIVTRGGMLAADLDERFVGAMQAGCGTRGTTANCRVNGGTNPGGGGPNPGGGNPEPSLRVSAIRFTGTPASGATYRLGEQIQAAVTFNEAVTVTGTPQLGLTVGTQTRQAVYDATQSKGTLVVFTYYVQATDMDTDGLSIAANALALNGGTITLASDSATAASLTHAGVGTDDTRKVDGSTDVVEHGDSREQATLLVLSARTTGGVSETGTDDDFRAGVATEQSAEVAGALEQAGDGDYFRVEVAEAGRLTAETTGTTDTVGVLQGATGQPLTEDDDGGTAPNFRVERQVQAGTYYVAVTGGDSEPSVGLYTLMVQFTPVGSGTAVESVVPAPRDSPPAAGAGAEQSRPAALRVNTETRGRLERAGEVDYFRVEVQAAGTVMVEASGAAAPAAYFGAGNGPLLPQGAGGRAAQAAWPVTAGTYHVAVVGGATRTQTGAYTLAVRFTAASEAGPLRATLLNVAPAQAWVHFYCGREQAAEAAACMAQVQCGLQDGAPVAWDVEVAPETIVSYWPGRTAADGTSADFAAALVAAGRPEAEAGQRTTCRVFSPDPLEVRAYTRIGQDVVPVAQSPAPLDTTAPTRVATLLNVAPAHALVHLSCRKVSAAAGEPADPCQARLQCGQQEGTPVAWEVAVAAETTLTYGPGGTTDDLATALVAAGKTEAEARRRTTCQVFSRDPLDAWAYTRVGGDLVSVTNPPAAVDAAAPTRVATLLNVAPAQAWVHFYCRKAHDPAAETVDPCNVRLQCGQQAGAPVAWDVEVAPETIVTYWPGRTTADGTPADFAAALVAAGKTEAEARRRTTCQVFSTDPVDMRGYTQVGGAVVPVANPPVVPAADAPPTRIGTLLNLAPAQAWVHFYCRKAHQPEAETANPCTVELQCGQQDGPSVGWDVEVAPERIVSYWPGRTMADGTSDNLAAALVAAGKTEAEARRRTTCQVFSADPVDVRGYTQLGETVVPVKN